MKYINFDRSVEKIPANKVQNYLGSGTHLVGGAEVSYAKVVEVFGKPGTETDGYKVDAEWQVLTPEGVATIYNYKDGKNYNGDDGLETKEITDWHIGGHTELVVHYVRKALGLEDE